MQPIKELSLLFKEMTNKQSFDGYKQSYIIVQLNLG